MCKIYPKKEKNLNMWTLRFFFRFFTVRCYTQCGLRSYATLYHPSVCPSVCDFQVPWSHRLEYFENHFMVG